MKFFIVASYSKEGAQGVLKTGSFSGRKKATADMINGLGGTLEAYYYTSNGDAYVICDLPNAAAAASIALTIKARGMGSITTTVLHQPEELDNTTGATTTYSHPGH